MRIRVKVDITKPLKRALRVKCANGESLMVTFTYERLPNFCYRCGVIGHLLKSCRIEFEIEAISGDPQEETLEWGDWLRSSPSLHRNKVAGGVSEKKVGKIVFGDPVLPSENRSG